MQRFDDPGLFYVPDIYKRDKKTGPTERPNRPLPPIPETGWVARADFPDLSAAKAISFDTETFDPDLREKGPGPRRGGYIVGVSVAVDGWARYFPIAHKMGGNLDKAPVMRWLKDQLGRKQLKVGANLLYDLDFLSYEGVHVEGPFFDVLYADPLIYEYHMDYSLDAVARRRLQKRKETDVLYKWCADAFGGKADDGQRANIWRSPVELVGLYAEADASLPLEVMPVQRLILENMQQLEIAEMEFALIPLLLDMRRRGVRISIKRCEEVDASLSSEIKLLEDELKINVYSSEDLAKFCDAEGIVYPRTELGNPSFVQDWLKDHPHPSLQKVSRLRKVFKMRDTFIRGSLLGTHINGRVHCELHPLRSDEYGTVSGRFSAANPNLQQIPSRDKVLAPLIRSCFLPEEGELWMKKDLSQIEFRLGVHYGKGEVAHIREQYRSDPKTSFYKLAASMTGLEYTPAKSLSLGTLYGMRVKKFAAMIGKPEAEAARIFYQFNAKLPFMKTTYDYYEQHAKDTRTEDEDGWVRTLGGRLCHLREGEERKALNRLLQGSCADWIKRAMLDAHEDGVLKVLMLLLSVHDELDLSVPRTKEAVEASREMHQILANTFVLSVPVLASTDLGLNWGELRGLEQSEIENAITGASA